MDGSSHFYLCCFIILERLFSMFFLYADKVSVIYLGDESFRK